MTRKHIATLLPPVITSPSKLSLNFFSTAFRSKVSPLETVPSGRVSPTTPLMSASSPPIASSYAEIYPVHPSVKSKLKRLVDIAGGIIGLSVTAVLFIPITIAIQLDNPGTVLYSQERCGVQGKRFRIWKFRSMVANADALKKDLQAQNQASGHIFKIEDDPRVTRVGKFLRKTSLDEFPQFLNVILGDMSMVGTRPPTIDEVDKYDRHHWQRLAVKPGITGEWQANGRSSVKEFEEIVEMDLAYQQKWSIAYDLQLIFKTIWVVFNKDGAC